jgi:hypothetical protein
LVRARVTRIDTAARTVVEHWQDAVDQGEIAGAPRPQAPTDNGMAYRDSGRRSATPPSSTTPGVTATTVAGWWTTGTVSPCRTSGDGATVGVLTLNADDDYERGETLIKNGQPVCVPG